MCVVGLTGGFGSGKSFVASLFRKLGAKVIDADKLGHKSLKRGSAVYKKVVAAFGKNILFPDLSINRKTLAGMVFSDRAKLEKLNRIVHPGIIRGINKRIRLASKNEILIVDAPLICETKITGLMDVLIVVKASENNQIGRCFKKFGMTEKDARRRIAAQMSLNRKIRMADYTVDNSGTKEKTKKQVRKIWRDLKVFGKSPGFYTGGSRSIKKGA
jgi:dephospho-CoA kinase